MDSLRFTYIFSCGHHNQPNVLWRGVADFGQGHFQFQQHYIILMLTVSLLYAALVHPKEVHQIFFGLAYLFIFPAMHLLLPIYSIANIIDQSWGTRDSVRQ